MAGVVVAAGALAVAAALAVGTTAVSAALVRSARAAGAADAAALGAADAAAGAVTGEPCDRATEVAAASGASIVSCSLDALVATISVRVGEGPFAAHGRARAGPPPTSAVGDEGDTPP